MKVQKLIVTNKELVSQCDKLFLNFLDSEGQYDDNYLKREKLNSFLNDLSDSNNLLLAAQENGQVLGFIYGYIEKRKDSKLPIAHICFLYVDSEYRNRKIATALMDNFLIELKNMNIEIVEIKSFEHNEVAKKLYQKYNFNVVWSNYRRKI